MNLHINTPYVKSNLNHQNVWLKMDVLQIPGSFKIRGIGYACQQYARQNAKRFIASSGGNAGIAVAYAGQILNIPTVVVVPETTTSHAISLIQGFDAEVIVHGKDWHEANELAQSLLTSTAAFIHPFDHPWLWEGHSTIIDEIAELEVKPQAIALAVGGGGLFSGVAHGLKRNHWHDVPIIAVETDGTASLHQSIQTSKHVELANVSGVATSLGAKKIANQAWQVAQQHPIISLTVTDHQAVKACLTFYEQHQLVIEPACGAVLAAINTHARVFSQFSDIAVIVCGGAVATLDQLQIWHSATPTTK